jgi:hypothetical protein
MVKLLPEGQPLLSATEHVTVLSALAVSNSNSSSSSSNANQHVGMLKSMLPVPSGHNAF